MLEIKSFVFGPFQTNTYVVSDEQHILLIDPACSNQYEQHQLYTYIESVRLKAGLSIIATHGHLDHLWGAKWATEQYHTPVLMHEADIPMAQAMQAQYDLFGIRATPEAFAVKNLKSEILNLKSSMSNFELLETPGHTPGSVCLYFNRQSIVQSSIVQSSIFTGDTLFRMGYGRTDLPGGDFGQLINSLERLFELPSDVRVFPGHGDPTTIGAERR